MKYIDISVILTSNYLQNCVIYFNLRKNISKSMEKIIKFS